jgi:ubiquinone/menaquinone biosynthesis C-methylase UbiE
VYTHGHHDSVLRSHRTRTVDNSAAYLADRLRPGTRVLDVGCGPGTITVDMAARVASGEVTAIDASADVIKEAAALAAAQGVTNIEFAVADVYSLPYPDDSFDVVHAHQVLQHLTSPVAALREMARVGRAVHALHLLSIGRNGRLGLPGGKPTWEPAGRAALERALG